MSYKEKQILSPIKISKHSYQIQHSRYTTKQQEMGKNKTSKTNKHLSQIKTNKKRFDKNAILRKKHQNKETFSSKTR